MDKFLDIAPGWKMAIGLIGLAVVTILNEYIGLPEPLLVSLDTVLGILTGYGLVKKAERAYSGKK